MATCLHAQNCSAHTQKQRACITVKFKKPSHQPSYSGRSTFKLLHAVQTLAWPWTEAAKQGWHRDRVYANHRKHCHRWSTYWLAPGTPLDGLQHCCTCCAIPARWQVQSEGCNMCCPFDICLSVQQGQLPHIMKGRIIASPFATDSRLLHVATSEASSSAGPEPTSTTAGEVCWCSQRSLHNCNQSP